MTTWTDARTRCEEEQPRSSTLASIQDSQTNDFLQGLTDPNNRPRTWVGGKKIGGVNGVWTWTDGSPWVPFIPDSPWVPFSPDPWTPGQPDNQNNNEDSLIINFPPSMQWNDDPDARAFSRICQYDPRDT